MTAATEARRQDTRSKIELGGLVVKAGLREADKAFILGLLLDGVERASDPELRRLLRQRGLRAFKE